MVINKGNYQMKVNLYHYLQGKSSFYERFFQQIKIRREYQSMNADKIKRMLDACYLAKRIRELLPELPEGVTPAYIQYMDVIHIIKEQQEHVKISDISDYAKTGRDKDGKRDGKQRVSQQICFRGGRQDHLYSDHRER